MVNNLGNKQSIINQYIAEIRDVNIQNDKMRFRRNLERIGEIMAYEISKKLEWTEREVITPLGSIDVPMLKEQPVIASILRAGLPMHQGILNIFDAAENAFISAYRKHTTEENFRIELEYVSCPELTGKTLVIADPMLATGSSMELTYKELVKYGEPDHVFIATIIASTYGIEHLKRYLPNDKISIYAGAIDQELTAKSYIVPGLGDAGDLAFGAKTDD